MTGRYCVDIIGHKFGKLTVLERAENKLSSGAAMWRCRCECGKEVVREGSKLRSGYSWHCGCTDRRSVVNTTPRPVQVRTRSSDSVINYFLYRMPAHEQE